MITMTTLAVIGLILRGVDLYMGLAFGDYFSHKDRRSTYTRIDLYASLYGSENVLLLKFNPRGTCRKG